MSTEQQAMNGNFERLVLIGEGILAEERIAWAAESKVAGMLLYHVEKGGGSDVVPYSPTEGAGDQQEPPSKAMAH